MTTPIRRMFVLLLSATVVSAACNDQPSPPTNSAPAKTEAPIQKLRIGGPPNISMLVLLARSSASDAPGTFEFVPIQTGKLAMDAVIAGNVDVGVLVDSNLAFVKFEGGGDLAIIASIQKKTDDGIVARRDRRIGGVADLKGKSVAYLPATTSHVFLARYLAAHGLTASDVKLVSMAPPAMQAAITRGDVDAISVWQPFRFNAMTQLGTNAVELKNTGQYVAQALLVVRRSALAAQRPALISLLQSLLEAERRAKAQPDQAVDVLANAIPMERQALQHAWAEYNTQLSLDDSLVTLLNQEGVWIEATQANFKGRAVPDYRSAIFPDLLSQVAPDRVSLSPAAKP